MKKIQFALRSFVLCILVLVSLFAIKEAAKENRKDAEKLKLLKLLKIRLSNLEKDEKNLNSFYKSRIEEDSIKLDFMVGQMYLKDNQIFMIQRELDSCVGELQKYRVITIFH
jgi:hypothetical protein